MKIFARHWSGWRLALSAAILLITIGEKTPAGALPRDPVDALRKVVDQFSVGPAFSATGPKEGDVKKLVESLKTTGELGRALTEIAWDRVAQPGSPLEKVYQETARKFTEEARTVMVSGNSIKKLALAHCAAALVRPQPSNGRRPFVHPVTQRLQKDMAAMLLQFAAEADAEVRAAALQGLGPLASHAEKILPVLAKLLASPQRTDRISAAKALAQQLQAMQEATQNAFGPMMTSPSAASVALLPLAGKGLQDADPEVRRYCLTAVQQGGMVLKGLAANLRRLQTLQKKFPSAGGPAGALGTGGKAGQPETALSLQSLKDALKARLSAVIESLGDTEVKNAITASAVLELLATVDHEPVTGPTARALESVKPGDQRPNEDFFAPELQKAVPALAKNLQLGEVTVQLAAIYVLESLEQGAADAVDALAAASRDKNPFVRWGAVRALGRMAPHKSTVSVPALTGALSDKSAPVRLTAVVALKGYGAGAKSAVPALIQILESKDEELHEAAIGTLLAIGTGAEPAIPALIAALKSPRANVRLTAAYALGRLGQATPAVIQGLRLALNDPDDRVRRAANLALLELK